MFWGGGKMCLRQKKEGGLSRRTTRVFSLRFLDWSCIDAFDPR
ncbi:hypothetical protein BC936DRAFT_137144 [Jimgerdemannia flammicorona]|uniref:Uncharacterized protein n=1 Tax=Jimgerdemannia flammicorona TaxID=994334 RepID=A0A433DJ74_9FUNG|nr:hypothetical protein BC936DRAFT_137144 [Jimgerdemannia flammicorona]